MPWKWTTTDFISNNLNIQARPQGLKYWNFSMLFGKSEQLGVSPGGFPHRPNHPTFIPRSPSSPASKSKEFTPEKPRSQLQKCGWLHPHWTGCQLVWNQLLSSTNLPLTPVSSVSLHPTGVSVPGEQSSACPQAELWGHGPDTQEAPIAICWMAVSKTWPSTSWYSQLFGRSKKKESWVQGQPWKR
jgi:hypothetical protein